MARINLLPWREEIRKKRQRNFVLTFVAAIVLTAVGAGAVYWYVEGLIDHQRDRNATLKKEIRTLDARLREINQLENQKQRMISRMEVIQNLQISRPQIVHLFDEVAATLPEGVQLNRLTQVGKGLVLTGRAQSNSRVSAYMRNIDAADWVGNPKLVIIQSAKQTQTGMSSFEMRAAQKVPPADALEEAGS